MSNLAIIPARGGSKRIPGKNIKDFLGKPIIAYSIQAALDSNLFDEVMVSTDDEEIAEVAIKYGAKVPFLRSSESADDYTPLASVVLEVIETYKQQNIHFESLATILSTAPFLSGNILLDAYQLFNKNMCDSLFSVVECPNTIFRSFQINSENNILFNFPQYTKTRSQDLPQSYIDAGQFYMTKSEFLTSNTRLSGGKCIPYLFHNDQVQDIDTIDDWIQAEYKFKKRNNEC